MTDELLELLADVSNGFERRLRDLVSVTAPDLLFSHAKLLAFVGRNPGCTQQVLAAAVERDKGQVARLVKELEARGMLSREPHPDDWRAQGLWLTASGQSSFERMRAGRAELGRAMLSVFSDQEQESVKQSLVGLLQGLQLVTSKADEFQAKPPFQP